MWYNLSNEFPRFQNRTILKESSLNIIIAQKNYIRKGKIAVYYA